MHLKTLFMLSLGGLTMLVGGCSGGDDDDDSTQELTLPEVDCETVTVPTFSQVTIWPECVTCHASTLSSADRKGAPADINFDVYASAKANAELAVHEVFEGSMPLGGDATEEQEQSLYAWGLCGTPE